MFYNMVVLIVLMKVSKSRVRYKLKGVKGDFAVKFHINNEVLVPF